MSNGAPCSKCGYLESQHNEWYFKIKKGYDYSGADCPGYEV